MPATLPQRTVTPPRKMLAMDGEALRKPLAEAEFKAVIGRAIERALHLSNLTKQEAAYGMGYGENQAPVSRWISGTETPQFAKLWMLGRPFQIALVEALADESGGFTIERVLRTAI